MRARLLPVLLGAVCTAGLLAPPATALAAPPTTPAATALPLGAPGLPETRTVERLAAGVTLTTIVRGTAPTGPVWTVTAGFLARRADADALAARVAATGAQPRVEQVDDPVIGDVAGFVVRTGLFATRAEAADASARLTAAGVTGSSVASTVEDGTPTTGPWVVRVLSVDPHRASVGSALATGVVPGREAPSAIAGRTGAVAAVNGGYFVIGDADGTPGDLAGVSVVDGDLVSEAVNGRSALVLGPDGGRVERLATPLRVHDGGASREIDGLNRRPGLIRSCGGVGGDSPTEAPRHDFTCTDPSELIAFDAAWGGPAGAGTEQVAALDRDGAVTSVGPGGDVAVPPGGRVLAGTGDGAAWLRAHAVVGRALRVDEGVVDADSGRPVGLNPGVDVVNGGPRLVRDGAVAVDAAAEGFVQPANPAFRYGFGIRRNPRTLAGVAPDGTILLVAADGHAPGTAVGLSFAESAAVLRSLGARDGLNLDGGGSTALVAGGRLRTTPSDATGERPVGDALVVTPR